MMKIMSLGLRMVKRKNFKKCKIVLLWGPPSPQRIYVAWAKHNRHQRMLLQLWLDIKLHVPNMDPPPDVGSMSQARPPSKDTTPAVIGHHTTQ